MTTDDVRDLFDQSRDDETDEDEPADERTGSALFGDEDPSDGSMADGPTDPQPADAEDDSGDFVSTDRSPDVDDEEVGPPLDGLDPDSRRAERDASGSSDPFEASSEPDHEEPRSADTREPSPLHDEPEPPSAGPSEGAPMDEGREDAPTDSLDSAPAADSGGSRPAGLGETSPEDDRTASADPGPTGAEAAAGTAERAPSASTRPRAAREDSSREAGGTASEEPSSSSTEADAGAAGSGTTSGSNWLTTGIDELDRAMGGGVPPGRLVVLVTEPGVQGELIVDSLLAQRDTLFVTTDRPDWEVTKDIEPGLGSGEVVIRDHTPDSLLSGVDSLLDELQPSSNFVLDSVNELELVPRQRYRRFLSDVKRRLFDTGSVGLLTGVTVTHESARDLTLRRADVVWRLETRTTGSEIENRLSVPKFRGGAAMTETVRLELTDEVRVVDSRDE